MDVISIGGRHQDQKNFSKDEAQKLLPILLHITRRTKNEVNQFQAIIQSTAGNKQRQSLEERIDHRMKVWSEKVSKLGTQPIGIWKVLIPNETGTPFEWEFPSSELKERPQPTINQ